MKDVLFFLLLGIFFTLPCMLCLAVFYKDYFSLAFAKERPRLLGKNAAQTDAIVFYYVTKVFIVCFVGVLVFYVAGIVKSLFK
jgi:TRAP-type mannitol/chloroaromatic compound transport system permease small subunit